MDPIQTIVLVCTGNTCRSVMAEAMLRKALEQAMGDAAKGIKVISAGVSACDGDPASSHAKAAMEKLGLDVSLHRARSVSHEMLSDADLVLTMTIAHKDRLVHGYPSISSKVMTLTEFADLIEELGESVEDPFGGSLEDYLASAYNIGKAVEAIAERIKRLSELRRGNHEDRYRE